MAKSESGSDSEERKKRRKEKRKERKRDDSDSDSGDRRRDKGRNRDRDRGDRGRGRDRERGRDRRRSPSPQRSRDRGEHGAREPHPEVDRHGRARSPIQLSGTYERKNDRSRSRDRRRSRSRDRRDRSRSRSPEKPAKKKSGWDVPTEEVQTGADVGMPIMAPQVLNETRQARRVYIGNLPGTVPPQEVVDFFNDAMIKAGLNKWAGPPIVQAVHQSQEGGFVFIELRDVDETTALLMYDGVIFKDRQLKVRRPADYNPPPSAGPDPVANPNLYAAVKGLAKIQGVVSTNVGDGPNKIYVGNLPNHLKPDQVKELVEMFGELKAFHLLVDNHDIGRSKGVAFLEYADEDRKSVV